VKHTLSKKDMVLISFMLFSMFFGAGNLIFPPFLGQSAGEQVWLSLAGFLLSAVGLPIPGLCLAVPALDLPVDRSRSGDSARRKPGV